MALLKSLKKVLTELGGTPDPKDSTTKTIAKIADNVSGGSGGGGSSAIIEEFTWDPGSLETNPPGYFSTHDASELFNAYTTGHTLLFHFPVGPYYSIPEFYGTLVTLVPPEEGSSDFAIGILVDNLCGSQSSINLSHGEIINGKLFIGPYID